MPLQGPRCARIDEIASITELADCVFMQGRTGVMGDLFPRLFHKDNRDNLFVFIDGERVVSHVGMVERKARIPGCGLHVACMGAVATYEDYRGRGLASQLVRAALDKARADGVDVMLISGDRTLYRRIGAFPVGRDFRCVLDADILDWLHNPRVRVRKALESDLPACAAAYDAKPVGFVRPMDEWKDYIDSKATAEGWHHLLVVEEDGEFRGYAAVHRGHDGSHGEVAEFGGTCGAAASGCQRGARTGERQASPNSAQGLGSGKVDAPHLLGGALRAISEKTGEKPLKITLQQHDEALRAMLAQAGAAFEPVSVDGAWTIVSFTRLMERLRPWIEARAGSASAQSMACSEDETTCTLSIMGKSVTLSRVEAVQLVFGTTVDASPSPLFGSIFPVPTIAYGIGYV